MTPTYLSHSTHNFIRYANCWEDAELLLDGLGPLAGQRILSIASGGDNSLALLSADPQQVMAVDINPAQLYLTALKRAAIAALNRKEYLAFAGFEPSETDRLDVLKQLGSAMPAEAWEYFMKQPQLIRRGLIHAGKFERYARIFARFVLPFIHSKNTVRALLQPKTEQEQREFYQKHWNTRRWRGLFRLFFSRTVLGRLGRDPEFLKQVERPVADFIYGQAAGQLSGTACFENPMLRYFLVGDFEDCLPYYVWPGVYERIRERVDRLVIVEGAAENVARQYGPFDRFNLSNIFEYMDSIAFRQVSGALLAAAAPGARLAYWNLMVSRSMAGVWPQLVNAANRDVPFGRKDQGFFYSGFFVDQKLGDGDSFLLTAKILEKNVSV